MTFAECCFVLSNDFAVQNSVEPRVNEYETVQCD